MAQKKITQFNRQNLRALRKEVDEALERIGRQHGIALQTGSCSFNGSGARMTLELRVTDGSGECVEASEFRQYAAVLGFAPDDLGREFMVRGTVFRIVGAKLSRRKYPVIGENARGTRYVFAAEEVRRTLLPRES